MARAYLQRMRSVIVGALGATILLGTPLLAQADQGKWWKPKEGDRTIERRDQGREGPRDQAGRGAWGDRGRSGRVIYRGPRYSGRASWGDRATWRGFPVRRDVLIIRDRRYGGFFRARRIYAAPRYYGRFVYVRPVRFFIGADALIGGIGIHARIVRPHYLYGCNFCDARFDSYDDYAAHVAHCDHRPGGFGISASNWDDGSGASWDGPYSTDEGTYQDDYHYDQGYDGGSNDGGYDYH
jgi:hypothetical protein